MENKINFDCHYETINGKKVLVIKPKIEEILREDGKKDVIVHAPSLSLIKELTTGRE